MTDIIEGWAISLLIQTLQWASCNSPLTWAQDQSQSFFIVSNIVWVIGYYSLFLSPLLHQYTLRLVVPKASVFCATRMIFQSSTARIYNGGPLRLSYQKCSCFSWCRSTLCLSSQWWNHITMHFSGHAPYECDVIIFIILFLYFVFYLVYPWRLSAQKFNQITTHTKSYWCWTS